MNKRFRRAIAAPVAACCLLLLRDARAAGIALDVQSGRGTGMASAVTAVIDDSSAIYYNPAGIAQGRGLDVMVGDTIIIPSFTYTSPSGAQTGNASEVLPPFQAYLTAGLLDNLSIGVGVFTPYGSTIDWPTGWTGRSLITSSALATYDINPTIAYRFGPVRLGAGLQVERATVELKKDINTGSQFASVDLGGDSWGVGMNAGAQLEVIKQYLQVGLHYRSAVTLDFTGNAHFSNVPPELQTQLHDQAVSTTLTNPDSLQIGIASHPIPRLVLDAVARMDRVEQGPIHRHQFPERRLQDSEHDGAEELVQHGQLPRRGRARAQQGVERARGRPLRSLALAGEHAPAGHPRRRPCELRARSQLLHPVGVSLRPGLPVPRAAQEVEHGTAASRQLQRPGQPVRALRLVSHAPEGSRQRGGADPPVENPPPPEPAPAFAPPAPPPAAPVPPAGAPSGPPAPAAPPTVNPAPPPT